MSVHTSRRAGRVNLNYEFAVSMAESVSAFEGRRVSQSTTCAGTIVFSSLSAGSGRSKISRFGFLRRKVVAEFFNNDIGEFNFRLFFVKVYRTTLAFVVSHYTIVQTVGVNFSNERTEFMTESFAYFKQKLSSQS